MNSACDSCVLNPNASLKSVNINTNFDFTVALAGNPNTGKSTVFNALTGLNQHTGNWSGKTVDLAIGGYSFDSKNFKLVDLPGTYSLLATSKDEEVTRDFITSQECDVVIIVADASRLGRNLNLVLQTLNICKKSVLCLNLIDEAERHGITVDTRALSRELGIPVVATSARKKQGIHELADVVHQIATGKISPSPKFIFNKNFSREQLIESVYEEANRVTSICVLKDGIRERETFDTKLDKIVTSKTFGFPIMILILAFILWLTITGANYPSEGLNYLLIEKGLPFLKSIATSLSLPLWLSGFLLDGIYLATAWVVAVMLPPMAIFFPMFTLLEDFGYLPRVAFNLDNLFRKAGTHGKQALTMTMGFGCNASGVVATRIIDSPRERLIAIITNNFSICNGRWGTQILLSTIFIGSLVPASLSSAVSFSWVLFIALLGIALSFAVSWLLANTVLKGQPSTFNLELPPYRPPMFWQTIYTSLINRTLIILWRAVVFAAPAGAIIWLISNINISGITIAQHLITFFNDFGLLIGLNGVIILAFIIAIPANEIVIPTILMLIVLSTNTQGIDSSKGVLMQSNSDEQIAQILKLGGWTVLTAINVMVFSLIHNPCSTTIYTIYKETKSLKWTSLATFLPLLMGFFATFIITQLFNLFS